MANVRRSRLLRPVRRFRRWLRHTPSSQIASTLTIVGISLVLIVGAVAFSVL